MSIREVIDVVEGYKGALYVARQHDYRFGLDWSSILSGVAPSVRKSWSPIVVTERAMETAMYIDMLEQGNARLKVIIHG